MKAERETRQCGRYGSGDTLVRRFNGSFPKICYFSCSELSKDRFCFPKDFWTQIFDSKNQGRCLTKEFGPPLALCPDCVARTWCFNPLLIKEPRPGPPESPAPPQDARGWDVKVPAGSQESQRPSVGAGAPRQEPGQHPAAAPGSHAACRASHLGVGVPAASRATRGAPGRDATRRSQWGPPSPLPTAHCVGLRFQRPRRSVGSKRAASILADCTPHLVACGTHTAL